MPKSADWLCSFIFRPAVRRCIE